MGRLLGHPSSRLDRPPNGLLQAEDYTRALWSEGNPNECPQDVEKLVEVRMRRKDTLTGAESPPPDMGHHRGVSPRRPIGGSKVMQEQLNHLNQITEDLPNVSVRVLPESVGAYPDVNGPFSILGFAPGESVVVHVESQRGNLYLEGPRDLRRCGSNYNHLLSEALSQENSTALISAVAKDFS